MAARVAGLILAGGAGERYGGPKAFATLPDGRTFLAACVQLLTAGGAAPLLVTLPPGASPPAFGGLEALPLPAPGLPMFDSLRLGLTRLLARPAWSAVVVLPVDHPLVAPETITALARTEADAVLPSHQGKHGHPVMLSRRVADRIASGAFVGPTLREVLRAVGARVLVVEDPGITANCNTPEALAAALARLRR
jgi:CTP:molybdopterin cytidylyltransferase MocA